jgi:hypothetical protein
VFLDAPLPLEAALDAIDEVSLLRGLLEGPDVRDLAHQRLELILNHLHLLLVILIPLRHREACSRRLVEVVLGAPDVAKGRALLKEDARDVCIMVGTLLTIYRATNVTGMVHFRDVDALSRDQRGLGVDPSRAGCLVAALFLSDVYFLILDE